MRAPAGRAPPLTLYTTEELVALAARMFCTGAATTSAGWPASTAGGGVWGEEVVTSPARGLQTSTWSVLCQWGLGD